MRAADAQKDKDMRSCLQADGERGQSHQSPVQNYTPTQPLLFVSF